MPEKRTGRIGRHRYDLVNQMIAQGLTAGDIACQLDVNPETIRKYARNRNMTIRRQPQDGAMHPSWKGGTTLDRSGYVLRRVAKDGPYGYLIRAIAKRGKAGIDRAGYAPVHRIVMHDMIGRPLRCGEVVDHIDGNRKNNDPSNLRLFASNAEHLRHTLVGRVPKWTAEGKARMTGRPPKNRAAIHRP
jgi:hypothetical protein